MAEVEEPDAAAIVKSSPVPERVMVCGLPSAVSTTAMAPVLVPPLVGLKVMLKVQLALTATLEPQLLFWEASPLTATLMMLRDAPPVFVRVTL